MTQARRLMDLPGWAYNLLPEEQKRMLLPLDQRYFNESNGIGRVRVMDVNAKKVAPLVQESKQDHKRFFTRFGDRNG